MAKLDGSENKSVCIPVQQTSHVVIILPMETNRVVGPVYALVPAKLLPTIDLSKSVRGQLLPAKAHATIHHFLTKYHRPLLMANMTAMVMNVVVTGVDALTGQIISVISLVLWLPMGIGAPSTLRYDIVRLIMRTFDFCFVFCTTTLTVLMVSIYFWDMRICRMMIDWIGFHNIVFIDGQVRGIRPLLIVIILGIPPLVFMLIWIMLDRLSGCTSFSLLRHKNAYLKYTNFSLSGVDIIGNGMVTLFLLIIKTVARKRQTLDLQRQSSLIECVIYRCGLTFQQVEGPAMVLSHRTGSAKAASKRAVAAEPSTNAVRESSLIQRMKFLKFRQTFDSSHILFPLRVTGGIILLQYGVGAIGFLLSFSALVTRVKTSDSGLMLIQWGALFCTLLFVVPYVALYQREVLLMLFSSFDFIFYVFQTTAATLCVCILYDWERARGLMMVTWWFGFCGP